MVNVSHNDNYRASRLQILSLILFVNDKSFLDGYNHLVLNLCANLFGYKRGGVKVDGLVLVSHNSQAHQLFDNVGNGGFQAGCKLGNNYLVGNHYLKLLLSCSFKLHTP